MRYAALVQLSDPSYCHYRITDVSFIVWLQAGGLAELVMLLSPAFAEEVSGSAAWAIHHGVYLNQQSQSLVAEAGGLSLLVHHLSAATVQLQTNALLALASTLESHVQNQKWCRENGVLDVLEQVEADDGDDMSTDARLALRNIMDELA